MDREKLVSETARMMPPDEPQRSPSVCVYHSFKHMDVMQCSVCHFPMPRSEYSAGVCVDGRVSTLFTHCPGCGRLVIG